MMKKISKREMKRKFAVSVAVVAVLSMSCVGNVSADVLYMENGETTLSSYTAGEQSDTMSVKLVWYYKIENGKTYKRLYDASNQVWLTDWILCE